MRALPALVLLMLATVLAACAPDAPVPPSPSPAPSQSPTVTTDWFPATATPTPRATAPSPTADMHPGRGEVLLAEDFADGNLWTASDPGEATVMVAGNRIQLTLGEARSYLISMRSGPSFGDFYAEIRVQTNLCRGEDEYGLVLRSLNAANQYRFALSCDGRAKVDRLYQNAFSNVVPWTANSGVPSLAPASLRLGVWAQGSELRFFVDDQYLFSLTDTLLFSGNLGVFVHASGEGDVSVSFSELTVWALDE